MTRTSQERTTNNPDNGSELAARVRDMPVSKRGVETRSSLINAARTVFEREGFLDARIGDIASEAGVANGSFYTYFVDKDDIFLALMEQVQPQMLDPEQPAHRDRHDLLTALETSNRAYLESYRQNAKLMGVIEQVSMINANFRERRRATQLAVARRNARLIKELQDEGSADPTLDPLVTAFAFDAMVRNVAFQAFVREEPMPVEEVAKTTTQLWINALKVPGGA